MATISSTLRLQDKFTQTIEHSISAVYHMVDAMENLNRCADMPNMTAEFGEIRADVSLATHALDQFNAELAQTDQHTNTVARLGTGFGAVSKAVIVANQGLQLMQQAWNGIAQLGAKTDVRTGTDARLSLINDGLRTQVALEAQVMQVANETRAEYEATGSLIAKIGRQDYFRGNNDAALAFAETLNKGLVVSGASGEEARNTITQLTQGLASGVLRGDEFNSVMENGSVIAEMMAQSLGVTKGQLRSMAEDGQLTTEIVAESIMGQSAAINEQFAAMPVTFGQTMTMLGNKASGMADTLSQPGQAIDIIVSKVQELNAWLDTANGAEFMGGITSGAAAAAEGIGWIMDAAADTYSFFTDNWTNIEPVILGIAVAVGGLSAAYVVYKGILMAMAVIKTIHKAATDLCTGATMQETAAQWGLNAALLACPLTWIVIAVIAVIAIIAALTLVFINLWKTNVDFKVGVISIWNGIQDFFDRVPGNFMAIGYGIADGFSYAKVTTLNILDDLVNGAIDRINWLIDKVNNIPGVSIDAVAGVTFGAETAASEAAARAERAAKLAGTRENAMAKSAERQSKLANDAVLWRAQDADRKRQNAAEESAKKQSAAEAKAAPTNVYMGAGGEYGNKPVQLAGGSIDRVGSIGKEVDISNQSLEYLRDIAEIEVLSRISSSVSYTQEDSLQLSKSDAELMRQSANSSTNVYYIQYQGGVKIKNDVRRGEDWANIAQQLREESQREIDTGISDMEGLVFG
ncbi:MAG: tape measure protein [Hydrogenoanaerobacterium sp.]